MKKNYTWNLPVDVVDEIIKLATEEDRSTANYIKRLLLKDIEEKRGKELADRLRTPD